MNLRSEQATGMNPGLLFGPEKPVTELQVEPLIPPLAGETAVLDFRPIDALDEPAVPVAEPAAEPTVDPVIDRAQQVRVLIDAAREEAARHAAEEARRFMEASTEAQVTIERRRILKVCDRFARDRQRYFAVAEEQVVRLAVAIAARVLHREAQADPMLLADTVRAALARIQEGSASVLRVPPAEVAMWSAIFPPGVEPVVQITADARMNKGDCALETIVGRVDFGIDIQLEEITRGFSELASAHDLPSDEVPR